MTGRRMFAVLAACGLVSALLGSGMGLTAAAFSSVTSNPGNTFQAAATFATCSTPGSTTVYADQDTLLYQGTPTTNSGTSSSLLVQSYFSGSALNYRSLLRFPLPAIPSGCALTGSSLQLYSEFGTSGRTLEAVQAGATWGEGTATWNHQPATTGAAASAASSAFGPVQWNVLAQTNAMYAGANNGFVLRDSAENGASQYFQWLGSRESWPTLSITFGGVGCTAPGTQVVTPDADAAVDQASPTTTLGGYGYLYVRSQTGSKNQRTLLHFPLPTTPAGCLVTAATLRLLPLSASTGRTLQAIRLLTPFTESTATWNTQPASTGTAATAASGSAPQFNVLSQVNSMYSGVNTGFLIRDATESNASAQNQWLVSREGVPMLTLTWGNPPSVPTAPSGLSASPGGGGIGLSWTDSSNNEDNFRIERSPNGTSGWAEIATVGAGVTTYADTGLAPSTTYYYRVRASNVTGNSEYSNTSSATTGAGCSVPGSQTVYSAADTLIYSGAPTTNYGTQTYLYVRSSTSTADVARSLVQFDLPAVPSGCSVTSATLNVTTSSGVAGRTIEAFRNAATWTETGVDWSTQPATTGSAASTASVAAGLLSWTVTTQVQSMYATSNFGFRINDASEAGGSVISQLLTSRESSPQPQLVVTFG